MADEHPSLVTPKAKEKKELSVVTEIRYVKVDELEELFGKLKEQLQPIDISQLQEGISAIKLAITEILEVLKRISKTDERERDMMDALHQRIKREK